MVRILLCASCAIAGPIPQPGAVSVIFTSTFVPPSGFSIKLAIVNQAEVDDVDRNFRVETLAQLIPDRFLVDDARSRRFEDFTAPLVAGGLLQTEGVQIFLRDARETLVGGDCVAAAEGLRDHARRAGGNGRLVSARDLNRFDIAGGGEFGVFVHGVSN